jgi:formylglycine-generating enzyme required for sulfatase activity
MNLVKLLRGSSWYEDSKDCRSAYRNRSGLAFADSYVSFRVCCLPPLKTMSLSKLLRGSSCHYNSKNCRLAFRALAMSDSVSRHIGFRVVCSTTKKIPSQSFGKLLLSLCNLFNA